MRWIAALSMRWILDPPPPTIPARHTHTQLYWTLKILPWPPTHTTYVLWGNLLSSCTPPKINKNSQTIKQLLLVADPLSRSKKANTHTHDISNWKLGYIMRNLWNFFIIFCQQSNWFWQQPKACLYHEKLMKLFYDFCQQQLKKESRRRRRRRRSSQTTECVCVCLVWRNFAKFRPKKYDFDSYRGSFMQKDLNGPNSPDFEEFFFSNRQIFLISSQ